VRNGQRSAVLAFNDDTILRIFFVILLIHVWFLRVVFRGE
jgi:hypothetical protein